MSERVIRCDWIDCPWNCDGVCLDNAPVIQHGVCRAYERRMMRCKLTRKIVQQVRDGVQRPLIEKVE